MFSTSIIEISQSALLKNLKFIRKVIGKKPIISSVVKGNAYGHGIETFVPTAIKCGQWHFSVFSTEEAYRVKKVTDESSTILIMGITDYREIEWAVENNVEFFVFDIDQLINAINIAKKTKKKANIHIEAETGMNRTGFNHQQSGKIIPIIQNNMDYLSIKGFCTHYAGAESISNFVRVKKQIKKYKTELSFLHSNNIYPEILHTACSAAALRLPSSRMDMVRIGILQYGYWPNIETHISYITKKNQDEDPLKCIIKWKTRIMSIKDVSIGDYIGYGTFYLASKNMRIATIPVGYSYGFSRSMSNHGRVLVGGKRVSVLGIVNMNCTIIDITDVPDAAPGDEVVLIGRQGDLYISVSSFSEMSNQLNYELLARLPENIPRVIVP